MVSERELIGDCTLPEWGTGFIGRSKQLEQVREQLAPGRLVTLTGVAGVGKTRLAHECARVPGAHRHVHWVDVWAVAADWLVAHTVGDVHASEGSLLVMDGCERWPVVAEVVRRLLQEHPDLTILATGREPIGIVEEMAIRIPPLGTGARSEAVRLFMDRLRWINRDSSLDRKQAGAVTELCSRLEGIPLALELAASLVRSWPVTEVLVRFKELAKGSRGGRHSSLSIALDLVYEHLLSRPERVVFRRLGAFGAGFRATDAALVTVETPSADLITRMAERTFLIRSRPDGTLTFSQSVWEDAARRLRESKEERRICDRHAQLFMAIAEQAGPSPTASELKVWSPLVEQQRGNLRAAVAWCLDRDPDCALAIAASLAPFWYSHGHLQEGRDVLVLALSASSRRDQVRQLALEGVARIAWRQQDYSAARGFLEESVIIQRTVSDRGALARALNGLGVLAIEVEDYSSASERFAESLEVMRQLGDRKGITVVLSNLGLMARYLGDRDGAAAFFKESLDQFRQQLSDMPEDP